MMNFSPLISHNNALVSSEKKSSLNLLSISEKGALNFTLANDIVFLQLLLCKSFGEILGVKKEHLKVIFWTECLEKGLSSHLLCSQFG